MAFWMATHKRSVNLVFWPMVVLLFVVLMIPNSKGLSFFDWLLALGGYILAWHFVKSLALLLILKAAYRPDDTVINQRDNESRNSHT